MTPRAGLTAAAMAALIVLYATWASYQRAIGARDAQLAQSTRALAVLTHTLDSSRAAFRTDTVRLVRRLDHTDTVLTRLLDTAIVHHTDTVRVPVTVLVAADSVIRACRVTIRDCGRLADMERARADTLAGQVKLLRAAMPGVLSRCGLALGYGAVLADGAVRLGPTVSAGCRVFP